MTEGDYSHIYTGTTGLDCREREMTDGDYSHI